MHPRRAFLFLGRFYFHTLMYHGIPYEIKEPLRDSQILLCDNDKQNDKPGYV